MGFALDFGQLQAGHCQWWRPSDLRSLMVAGLNSAVAYVISYASPMCHLQTFTVITVQDKKTKFWQIRMAASATAENIAVVSANIIKH